MTSKSTRQIAIVGATGYVGRLLTKALLDAGRSPICISRRKPAQLSDQAEWRHGDVMVKESLEASLQGVDVAYYLVHALADDGNFEEMERVGATNFSNASEAVGIKRTIYLGALAQEDEDRVTSHIASRHSVGKILRDSTVPATELRASVIIGAGSMPFEAIRALVERLPIMVTPRWVGYPVQPIGERDLVKYLLRAASDLTIDNHVYEIGGSDRVTYRDLLADYAKARGLRRLMVPVPVITPRLSSLWLRLITPANYRIGRRIVDSVAHDSVVSSDLAEQRFNVKPMSSNEAVSVALVDERESLEFLDSDADMGAPGSVRKVTAGTIFIEQRSFRLNASPERAFEAVRNIGGENTWYWGDWLWRLRGAMDRAIGGGMRRDSGTVRNPRVGERLDFWRVERYDPGKRLTLRAEMKLPGDAWLDLQIVPDGANSRLLQTAAFDHRGLPGLIYWYGLQPLHSLVFRNLGRGLAERVSSDRISIR